MKKPTESGGDFAKTGVKKVLSALITQAVILGLSFITGFVMPKYMGPEKFGYWQIYIFYINFLNLFGLGFNDGFALFYGGFKFEDLPFKRVRSGMRVFYLYLLGVTAALLSVAPLFGAGPKKNIYITLALNVPLACLTFFVMTVFLSVNKTAVYNGLNFLMKALATVFFVALLLSGLTRPEIMMGAETAARIIVTLICLVIGRRFLFGRDVDYRLGVKEFSEKTRNGVHIMLGIIASTFIPVAGRLVVEHTHPIAEYGLYSFATSLLTIVITFTNTAGVVIFPVLKTLPEKHLPALYPKLSYICGNLIYVAFFVYVPFVILIRRFMPEYIPIFSYMHVLLSMCLPLGKVHLLIIPYFKALRHERAFLLLNTLGVAVMLASTLAAELVFNSVFAISVAMAITMFLWFAAAEAYIVKKMGKTWDIKTLLQDILFVAVFILSAGFGSLKMFLLIYGALFVLHFILNCKNLRSAVGALRMAENPSESIA